MRRVFLWAARNAWLREHLPTHAVHAPRGSPVHARRDAGVRPRRRRAAAGRRHRDDVHASSARTSRASPRRTRSPTTTSRSSTRSGTRGLDGEISVKPTQLGLDIDEDRALAHLDPHRRARRRDRLVPLDRHGGQRLHRGHDPAVRAAPRGPAAHGDLPAGVPPAHGRRHRAAAPARPGDPAGQGRLRRAGGDRLSRQAPGRRQLPRPRRRRS